MMKTRRRRGFSPPDGPPLTGGEQSLGRFPETNPEASRSRTFFRLREPYVLEHRQQRVRLQSGRGRARAFGRGSAAPRRRAAAPEEARGRRARLGRARGRAFGERRSGVGTPGGTSGRGGPR